MPDRALQTARLLLRPFQPTDVPAYAAIREKPEVMRHMPGGTARCATAAEDAARLVALFASQWDSIGYGPWAALERVSGRLLGHLGLRLLPEMGGETELLYLLDSAVWGRGCATEGAAAARDFAFSALALPRLVGFAVAENIASRRVLERTGLRPTGPVEAFGLSVIRHVLDAPEAARYTAPADQGTPP